MAKVARLIIYDSEDDHILANQIANSLSEGIHNKNKITITVINLSSYPIVNGFVEKESKNLEHIDSSY